MQPAVIHTVIVVVSERQWIMGSFSMLPNFFLREMKKHMYAENQDQFE